MPDHKLSVAPMMGCTDRHCRFLLRMLAPHALLYTEMITSKALIFGDANRFLRHDDDLPCALQLGGNDPDELARSAVMGEAAGYSEINLNLGCPSSRVRSGEMGACLMYSPDLVARCISKMHSAVGVPVTVKCRTGVDEHDGYDFFADFVLRLKDAGCTTFVVHARKAILGKLSPKENRNVPPLQYEHVYRIKEENPDLTVVINGALTTMQQVDEALLRVDGVMIGREAYRDPMFIARLDRAIHSDDDALPNKRDVVNRYLGYMEENLAQGEPLRLMVPHLQGLFLGMPGARAYRSQVGSLLAEKCDSIARMRDAVSSILESL